MLGATIFAAMAPVLFADGKDPRLSAGSFPGWPQQYEDKPLTALNLTERERAFVRGFPGEVGRFSDGTREIIIRWVESPTRRLHPAADCFKGVGYSMSPLPVKYNRDDVPMGCFMASKDSESVQVCEYIVAGNMSNDSDSWSDVSSWYWQSLLSGGKGGWWSFVVSDKYVDPRID